ncbi:MAG TPA: YfhO family protein, partial [Longimicrobiales bacterium]
IALDGGPVEGSATWTLRDADRQVIEVTSDQNALLVIADNWFPAWHATVDGAPTPVLRAYHTLRAVPVGPGQHTVELVYRSATLRWSLVLSLGTVLVLVAVGVGSYVRGARGRESGEA